ncbi:MAG: ribonuclease Z [Nitrospirae bacterium]|nr:ribonuclease Z [Nitrospirota bacterium]
MKPLLHSQLINGPFDDPGFYVDIMWDRRALLFDLGDITSLTPSQLLKVTDVFVSHMHMDHFIGFDHLLRIVLNREKSLRIFGPQGITDCVEGKLRGYTWNLTEDYPLALQVIEINNDLLMITKFSACDGFKRLPLSNMSFSGVILEEEMFTVRCAALDHKIPSLAFALKERFHININRDKLDKLKLEAGPWLRRFKQALWEGSPDDGKFEITESDSKEGCREFTIGELKDKIATITEGQKLSYVVDAVYNRENEEKIIELVRGSDILYCEAAYLDADMDIASERFHLTARQTGELARKAGVKEIEIFHFSPRYQDNPADLHKEAMLAFHGESP